MAEFSSKWTPEDAMRKINSCLKDNLDLAGFSTLIVLQKLVGRNQPTKKVGGEISKKSGKKIGGNKIGLKPSRPGKPPKRVTATLQKSYNWEVDTGLSFIFSGVLKGRLSSPLKYAKFLELGTTRMKKRPHLVNSMFINKSAIIRALSRPCPGGL